MTDASTTDDDHPTLTLVPWTGPWDDDDKDANFKAEIAAYATSDPLGTITTLSESIGVPVGSIVRYVLARWASEGSSALLELGPTMVRRLREPFAEAEAAGSDAARLEAYEQVRRMVEWLNVPLDHPGTYPAE